MDEWVHGWIDRQIDSLVRLEPIRLARLVIDQLDRWMEGWIDR